MKRGVIAVLSVALFAAGAIDPSPAAAGESTLREVMQGLGEDYGELGEAILAEEFEAAREAAHDIAFHPRPAASERMRVLAALGSEMSRFKRADTEVHHAARELEAAAEREDVEAVLAQHARLTAACMGCHTAFRDRVVAALR